LCPLVTYTVFTVCAKSGSQTTLTFLVPKSVLIVDDCGNVRKIVRNFLEARTEWVVAGEAENGLQAVDIAQELKPDLVILDFAMPGMNGIEAACVLKNMLPHVRIVLFTMFDEILGNTLTSAVGIDLVFPKPDGLTALVQAATRLLEGDTAEAVSA
jgi:DNA-binding NarL/FixJ family response regulator